MRSFLSGASEAALLSRAEPTYWDSGLGFSFSGEKAENVS